MFTTVEKAQSQLFGSYIEKVPDSWFFEDFEKGYEVLQGPSNCHMKQDSALVNPDLGIAFGADGVSGVNGVNAAIMGRNPASERTRPSFFPGEIYSQSSYNLDGPAINNPGGYASYHLLKYIQNKISLFTPNTNAPEYLQEVLDGFPDYLKGLFMQEENLSVFMNENAWVDDYPHPMYLNDYTAVSFMSNLAGVWRHGDEVYAFSVGDASVDVRLHGQNETALTIGFYNDFDNTSDSIGLHFFRRKNIDGHDESALLSEVGNFQALRVNAYELDSVESIEIRTDGARNLARVLNGLSRNPNYHYDDATLIRISDPRKFFV